MGSVEFVEKITEGWFDFDIAIATPDMMGEVGKLGKLLGPRGLMPNPKSGTVTFDVAKAVSEAKAGKIEYRVDKGANIHVPVGKMSFEKQKLVDNIKALAQELMRAKPSSREGQVHQEHVHLLHDGPVARDRHGVAPRRGSLGEGKAVMVQAAKTKKINDLETILKGAKCIILSDFTGLNVKDISALRRACRREGHTVPRRQEYTGEAELRGPRISRHRSHARGSDGRRDQHGG